MESIGESIDITIIGGGCNGLAAGLALAKEYPEKTIAIFEKQKFLGEEQSGHHSGGEAFWYLLSSWLA